MLSNQKQTLQKACVVYRRMADQTLKLIHGPKKYDGGEVRRVIARHGGNPNAVPNGLAGKVEFGGVSGAAFVIKPCNIIWPALNWFEEFNTVDSRIREDENQRDVEVGKSPINEEKLRRRMVAELGVIQDNYNLEATVLMGGVECKSNAEARTNLMEVINGFQLGIENETVEWKGIDSVVYISDVEAAKNLYSLMYRKFKATFKARTETEQQILSLPYEELIKQTPMELFASNVVV